MNFKRVAVFSLLVAAAAFAAAGPAAAATPYRKPPQNVEKVLLAPAAPYGFISPRHDLMLLGQPVKYPPISYLAEPMLRLGGVRVTPRNRGVHNAPYMSSLDLLKMADGSIRRVAMPDGAKIGFPAWTTDGKNFAFTVIGSDSVELWVGDAAAGTARKLEGIRLNGVLGAPLQWMPDQRTLLVKTVPDKQGQAPAAEEAPTGADVQEASGEKGPSSTYEVRDVLKGAHDEDLFDYYGASQLALVDAATGKATLLGKPALYTGVSPSPDGLHILVEYVHRPYSYITTYDHFPAEVEIWDPAGRLLHKAASLPLFDSVPIWGVPTGPREFQWKATDPATLFWAEALDGGNWKMQVPNRDRLLTLKAPFDGEPAELFRTGQRFDGILWLEDGTQALVYETDLIKHWARTWALDLTPAKAAPRLVWDLSSDDRYNAPGSPVLRALPSGFYAVQRDGDSIYLNGGGASPDGDRPFLDRLDLKTLKTERLFRSEKTAYERFAAWADGSFARFITRRETPQDPPNFAVRTLTGRVDAPAGEAARTSSLALVTHFPNPTPELRGITKKLVKYKRADGVDLSFTLYLPPGYKEGTRLPAVLWAYPLDYSDPKMAGQVVGSTQRFTTIGWPLQLFFLLDGYAVIDNPLMPVIGDTNKMYDTYMEQLVAGAKAAVDKAVDMGVVDRNRIGVTGHSHGALMTANLLANSDLFRAGIARSGAYNRSLTAFGFQNERRTLWEAPDVYLKVSPFFHADKLKLPLMLIHGEADVNPGTVPLQSQQFYEALRGNGGTVRLVMLPYESHGYSALESIEDVLAEMLDWFGKYVKNAK
jgi:dipeptidyl aminopeptidase/acylaminoacyl peptidase